MEKEREDFEAWAASKGYYTCRRTEDGTHGSYIDALTQQAWEAWLARAALDRGMPPLMKLPETGGTPCNED